MSAIPIRKCYLLENSGGMWAARKPRAMNVPPTIVTAIERAVATGIIVTISSRAVAGRVRPRYGYDGGGLHLLRAGAILAGDLPAAKARLLVMVALGFAPTIEDARLLVTQATQ